MTHDDSKHPDPYHDTYSKTIFGFWIFLLTDFVLFGTLLATYIVLAGQSMTIAKGLLDVDYAFNQSLLMLGVSFFVGLGGACAHRKEAKPTLLHFSIAFVLAAIFMILEVKDLNRLLDLGMTWKKNGVLSGFYTIMVTHAIHVVLGLLWIPVLLVPVIKEGLNGDSIRRLTCLRMFFQFLNITWVFVFAIIFLMGQGGV